MKLLVFTLALIYGVISEDVRLLDLDPPEAEQIIESKDQTLKYAPKIESSVPAVRFLGNEPHNVVEDIYLANQYHGQDGLGGYLYGYSVPDIAKTEKKKAGGDLRGAYNYINGQGQEIKVEYWDDGTGFHQVDNVPKILPQQIDDLPEVKAAKEEHARLWQEQALRNSKPIESPFIGNHYKPEIAAQIGAQSHPGQSPGQAYPQQYQGQYQNQQHGNNQYPGSGAGQYQGQSHGSSGQYQGAGQHQGSGQYQGAGQHQGSGQYQGAGQYQGGQQHGGNQYQGAGAGQYQGQSQGSSGQYQGAGQHQASGQHQAVAQYPGAAQHGTGSQGFGGQQNAGQYQGSGQYQGQQHGAGQYQGGGFQKPGVNVGFASGNVNNIDYSGQYTEPKVSYANPPSQGLKNEEEEEEVTGPPKGFFYNFDYPVGIIVSKDGGSPQHKRESITDIYNKNKEFLEKQLQGGTLKAGAGYPQYQITS